MFDTESGESYLKLKMSDRTLVVGKNHQFGKFYRGRHYGPVYRIKSIFKFPSDGLVMVTTTDPKISYFIRENKE